ncbi:MAG TPA: sugar porter family MFS transporter [Solirubrobacteraceae bacterium]|nr:sugar porter family MFS transporter [Solirubrobacteraceae bacterium]
MSESDRHSDAEAEQISLAAIRSTPRYTYLIAAIAAIGGMLFGYDIGVISGAENLLKARFHLSSGTEELAVAAVLIGSVIGGMIGGRTMDTISRRWGLLVMAVIYAAGAILSAIAWDLPSFVAFRIITGVAVGASSLMVPAYIAELAPVPIRGGLVILQQLAISGGILISYALDYLYDTTGLGWRPMFATAVIPALALGIGMLFMSHSPRWLAMQGRMDEAEEVLARVDPENKEEQLESIRQNVEESRGSSWKELLAPGMRGALIAGVGLAIFQQFVGPNTVLFYTPTIFGFAGMKGNPLLPTIYVGAVLFVFVFPTIALVDVIGRKALFYLGLIGMGSMLVLLGFAFESGASTWGFWVVIILLVYVACYSLSISPLFWLMSAEVFPNRFRGIGASACTVSNWGANLLVTVTFLSMISAIGKSWTFWVYAILAGLAILFVWRRVPETKGRPLELIDAYWTHDRDWEAAASAESDRKAA